VWRKAGSTSDWKASKTFATHHEGQAAIGDGSGRTIEVTIDVTMHNMELDAVTKISILEACIIEPLAFVGKVDAANVEVKALSRGPHTSVSIDSVLKIPAAPWRHPAEDFRSQKTKIEGDIQKCLQEMPGSQDLKQNKEEGFAVVVKVGSVLELQPTQHPSRAHSSGQIRVFVLAVDIIAVDYLKLKANATLLSAVKSAIQDEIALASYHGITKEHVVLDLEALAAAKGVSVVVEATITPPSDVSVEAVLQTLSAVPTLGERIAKRVASVVGIAAVTESGKTITASVPEIKQGPIVPNTSEAPKASTTKTPPKQVVAAAPSGLHPCREVADSGTGAMEWIC